MGQVNWHSHQLNQERFNTEEIRDLLHAICESNPEAIVITDLQTHQILKTNARAEELFGCDLDPSGTRPISLKYLLSTSSANAKSVEEQIDFYAQVGEASGFEQLTLLCPDYRRISLYTTPVRSRSGDILARIWSFRNLTQQLYFEKQLRQMSRLEMNNRMGSTLAHDIKNMLQIMQTNLEEEIEDRTLPENSPLRQTMRAIEQCSELTQRLTHSDHRITERETCGIQALMNEAVTLLRHITRHNIRIEIHCYDASLNVRVNKEQIMQTLLNLCLNAADAMPGGGKIRLRSRNIQAEQYGKTKRYLALDIEDDGPGIAPSVRPHIFNAFFTTKGHKDGSGLGLYSAHMAVKDHGGWITCESIFDKGSCFTIFLPSFEAKPEEEDSAR